MTKMVIGLVLIAVALIVFPIVMTGANEVLNWTGTGSATVDDFTGLGTLVQIAPLLIFIGFLAGGGILTFYGVKGVRASRKNKRNLR
jgi:hypothetical protein